MRVPHPPEPLEEPELQRIFLLSPANCAGRRAGFVLRPRSTIALAVALRSKEGAALGEIFSFVSGLYFRGKLQYATTFASPPPGLPGVLVITPRGALRPPQEPLFLKDLRSFAARRGEFRGSRWQGALRREAKELRERLSPGTEVVLLGSLVADKYVTPLSDALAPYLRVPAEFAGIGQLSRGSLLLKAVARGTELRYVSPPNAAP